MKVTHVVDSISRNAGGVSAVVKSLTSALLAPGDIEISVDSIRDGFADDDLPDWAPVPVSVHDPTGPRRFGFSNGLAKSLGESRADLIHVHAIWQGQSAAVHRAHRAKRVPYVVSPHGMLDGWALRHSSVKKKIASLLYEAAHLRDARGFHALAESERQAIRDYGIKQPVWVIPNGVDLPDLGTTNQEPGTKNAGRKTLLFLGRLHPKKGLVEAIRAWKEVTGRGSRVMGQDAWRLVIAGWDQGGHEAELKRLCAELEISFTDKADASDETSIRFVGPTFGAAKEALLRNADAFILPSHSEGLPMAVLEAWSYGLPVVMTAACNLPEGFENGAALPIDARPDSISEGLRALITMSDRERSAMGEAGRQLVESRFTWPKVAAQMKEVYEWIVGGGPKPGMVE